MKDLIELRVSKIFLIQMKIMKNNIKCLTELKAF
jgi:hypothetical protein